jgi:hypothetical protein
MAGKKRGPKKGWKKARVEKLKVQTQNDITEVNTNDLADPLINPRQNDSVTFGMEDREAIYAEADKHNHGISPEETDEQTEKTKTEVQTNTVIEKTEITPTETTAEQVEEEVKEQTTETVPEKTDTVDSTVKETANTLKTDFVKEEKPFEKTENKTSLEDNKTVPHGAFHKERELRKGYQNEVEELREKLAAEKRKSQSTEETDEQTEEETEVEKLRREVCCKRS